MIEGLIETRFSDPSAAPGVLAFDRIGLPDTDVPLTAKMVAVANFNVDKQGRIIGHGEIREAGADAAEDCCLHLVH